MNFDSLFTAPFTEEEINTIRDHLFKNIATEKNIFIKTERGRIIRSIPGAIMAAPARPGPNFSQDYRFDWMRDSAITMYEVIYTYSKVKTPEEKALLKEYVLNYMNFVSVTQSQPPLNGVNVLGEPKFNIDGTLWTGHWARPQNDSPAFRVISLIFLANIFIAEGIEASILNTLYSPSGTSLIKNDLEYIAKCWHEKTADPWEEVEGLHFFTLALQRKALFEGAQLADSLNDSDAGSYYRDQAAQIEQVMDRHWNQYLGYYNETLSQVGFKGGGLTASVLLGLIYGRIKKPNDLFGVSKEKSLSSAYYIRYSFEGLYQINAKDKYAGIGGPVMGRYENDVYDGYQSTYGNPWFLITNLFAKFYYMIARDFLREREIELSFLTKQFYNQIDPKLELGHDRLITRQNEAPLFDNLIQSIIMAGDNMLNAVKHHAEIYEDGTPLHLSEQLDRGHGHQVSAQDLTWSYSSLLGALQSRERTISFLKTMNKL